MKTCYKCKKRKSTGEFRKDRSRPDGLQSACKTCQNAAKAEYIKSPKGRAANARRMARYLEKAIEKRREYNKKYRQTDAGKASRLRTRLKNRLLGRINIYAAVQRKLEKQPCERCGSSVRVHAHHDDYSRPLDVMWLCPKHHAQRHMELKSDMAK